ncbi:glycoside hydrolase family 88 protein [Termitidicoccus mucosus]|uniref:Glucuronyl hydrolase n=1 Tax=Termitidicoccus mucosus TaxID=1184151 RepID=A0A178IMY8_9BACT|nr:hypothetical protein AW736_07090 [Opitutaceae bacterium TSB47]
MTHSSISFHRPPAPRSGALAGAALFVLSVAAISGEPAGGPDMARLIAENFDFAARQYSVLLDEAEKTPDQFPRTFEDGKLLTSKLKTWTVGFFPGSLWLIREGTGDAKWNAPADRWTRRLDGLRHHAGTHDLGFMLYCAYGTGLRAARGAVDEKEYKAVLLDGAQALASRFNPAVGSLRSWDREMWAFPVIIDNMMNLEFLCWATAESGNPRYRDIAIAHAHKTLANHFRADGSSYHLVTYNPVSGAPELKRTWQGYGSESAWSRGQAWALYGYTMMWRETRNPLYLDQAKRIAEFIVTHARLPEDKVPYWDFDAPGIPDTPRDSSAAAIMASAFIELADHVEPFFARRYAETARRQLVSLSSPAYRAKLGENGGFLLMHGTGHYPHGIEVDRPLSYGDYYFLEALLRYRARLGKTR